MSEITLFFEFTITGIDFLLEAVGVLFLPWLTTDCTTNSNKKVFSKAIVTDTVNEYKMYLCKFYQILGLL